MAWVGKLGLGELKRLKEQAAAPRSEQDDPERRGPAFFFSALFVACALVGGSAALYKPSDPSEMSTAHGLVLASLAAFALLALGVWVAPKLGWRRSARQREAEENTGESPDVVRIVGTRAVTALSRLAWVYCLVFVTALMGTWLGGEDPPRSAHTLLWFSLLLHLFYLSFIIAPATVLLESIYWTYALHARGRVLASVWLVLLLCAAAAFALLPMQLELRGRSYSSLGAWGASWIVAIALFWWASLWLAQGMFVRCASEPAGRTGPDEKG